MFKTAENWIDRFVAAGCSMQVDGTTMYPVTLALPVRCRRIMEEIEGAGNVQKWRSVEDAVRRRARPLAGWATFP
jgi:hypothetical protein